MLEEIKRCPSAFIQGDDLAVHECVGWEPFTSSGDLWKLLREEGFSSGPERHSRRISTGKTAVPVKFDLVEPFLTMGKFLNRQCIHRLDKANLGQRESTECFCFHKEAASVDTFNAYLITLSAR